MIITGIVQVKQRSSGRKQLIDLTVTDALIVGIAQGLAVVPGFSRSGFTAGTLVWRGYGFKDWLEPKDVDEYSCQSWRSIGSCYCVRISV